MKTKAKITIAEKNYMVDLIEMRYRPLSPDNNANASISHTSSPVFVKATLKPDFNIENVFEQENIMNEGNKILHAELIKNLLELLKCDEGEEPIDSDLCCSALLHLLHLNSLNNMSSVFIEVYLCHMLCFS
jgi:hypothetical protein